MTDASIEGCGLIYFKIEKPEYIFLSTLFGKKYTNVGFFWEEVNPRVMKIIHIDIWGIFTKEWQSCNYLDLVYSNDVSVISTRKIVEIYDDLGHRDAYKSSKLEECFRHVITNVIIKSSGVTYTDLIINYLRCLHSYYSEEVLIECLNEINELVLEEEIRDDPYDMDTLFQPLNPIYIRNESKDMSMKSYDELDLLITNLLSTFISMSTDNRKYAELLYKFITTESSQKVENTQGNDNVVICYKAIVNYFYNCIRSGNINISILKDMIQDSVVSCNFSPTDPMFDISRYDISNFSERIRNPVEGTSTAIIEDENVLDEKLVIVCDNKTERVIEKTLLELRQMAVSIIRDIETEAEPTLDVNRFIEFCNILCSSLQNIEPLDKIDEYMSIKGLFFVMKDTAGVNIMIDQRRQTYLSPRDTNFEKYSNTYLREILDFLESQCGPDNPEMNILRDRIVEEIVSRDNKK